MRLFSFLLRQQNQTLEVDRVTAELARAVAEAEKARAAEEANELTLVAVLARNKELEESRDAAEQMCREQAERFEADIHEVSQAQRRRAGKVGIAWQIFWHRS